MVSSIDYRGSRRPSQPPSAIASATALPMIATTSATHPLPNPTVRPIVDPVADRLSWIRHPSPPAPRLEVQDHVRALKRRGLLSNRVRTARGFILVGSTPAETVPILGTVPAGTPLEAVEVSEGWLTVPMAAPGRSLFALRVRGDSMRDVGILE